MSHFPRPANTVRVARPEDAVGISALYDQAYRPHDGGSARDHYPFPQFLDAEWVAKAVVDSGLCWVVAMREDQIIGSAGAVRNIGSRADQVAEVFGIVVHKQWRGCGLGTELLRLVYDQVAPEAFFVLCESRTALSSGWKIAQKSGFIPIGFEPFAHSTPAGSESMLLTARISARAADKRNLQGEMSNQVKQLSRRVLSVTGLSTAQMASDERQRPFSPPHFSPQPVNGEGPTTAGVTPSHVGSLPPCRHLELDRHDRPTRAHIDCQSRDGLHQSGVVGLRRLEGEDLLDRRYRRLYYVGRHRRSQVAVARVVWDQVDFRARILELRTMVEGTQHELLALMVTDLERLAAGNRLTLVVDVLANAASLHATLESMNLWPTAYYPSLVAGVDCRLDAVQYTRLFNSDLKESLYCLPDIHWPQAQTIAAEVCFLHPLSEMRQA